MASNYQQPNPYVQVAVAGVLSTTSTGDTFATTHPVFAMGGLKYVDTLADRNTILPNLRIPEITVVYVYADTHFYQLQGGVDNANWVDLGTTLFGGSGGTATTLTNTLIAGNTTGPNDIIISTDQVLRSDVVNGVKFNLNNNIFNDPSIYTESIDGYLISGVMLTGFVYYLNLDYSTIYPSGAQIQIKDSLNGVNDGYHILISSVYDPVNHRTELQWSGMVQNVVSDFGTFTLYDGLSWKFGSDVDYFHNSVSSFKFEFSKDVYMRCRDNRMQLSTGDLGIVMNRADGNISLNNGKFIGAFADWRYGSVDVIDTSIGDYTTLSFAKAFPSMISSENSTVLANVYNSVGLGLNNGGRVKQNNTAYVNQLAFNSGLAGDMTIQYTPDGPNDHIATIQPKSGTIAYLNDIQTTPMRGVFTTAGRPAVGTLSDGDYYMDTTLGKPIWVLSGNYIDATGVIV